MPAASRAILTLAQDAPAPQPQPENRALDQAADAVTKAAGNVSTLIKSDPWRWGHIIAAVVAVLGLLFADIIRPGSLERGGKRDVSTFGAHIWFLCGVLVLGMQTVAGQFALFLPETWSGPKGSVQSTAILQGVTYSVSILCAYLLSKLISASAKNAGLAFTARSTAWGLMAFVLAWPVVQASSFLWLELSKRFHGPEPVSNIAHDTLSQLVANKGDPWAWVLAGLAIIAAPVVEDAGEHDAGGVVVVGHLEERVVQWHHELEGHRVHPLGPVERDDGRVGPRLVDADEIGLGHVRGIVGTGRERPGVASYPDAPSFAGASATRRVIGCFLASVAALSRGIASKVVQAMVIEVGPREGSSGRIQARSRARHRSRLRVTRWSAKGNS